MLGRLSFASSFSIACEQLQVIILLLFKLCRNSNAFVNSNSTPGQPRLLDLHGLHVGEAIPVLKREIAQLRFNVSRTRQREQVYICVGTGHHTKGSRTPSRLPTAVQRYLIEEEHLQFTEPQPGMLRIIIRWPSFPCSIVSFLTGCSHQSPQAVLIKLCKVRQVHLMIALVCKESVDGFPLGCFGILLSPATGF